MLVTSKALLLDAQKNHSAVGAFNVENMEMVGGGGTAKFSRHHADNSRYRQICGL